MTSLTNPFPFCFPRQSNVLISEGGRACISDIRLYLVVSQSDFTTAYVAGSCRWAAPEIMDPPEVTETGEDDLTYETSTAADVYAFSMTVLEVRKRDFHTSIHKL